MPQELPGLYFDPVKNRYFPIKGRIPGSASASASHSKRPPPQEQETNEPSTSRRNETKTTRLLQLRELFGKKLSYKTSRCDFQHECQKTQASHPMIWKYRSTERVADNALAQLRLDTQLPEGQGKADFLLTGSMSGSLSLCEVGQVGVHLDNVFECMPDPIWRSTTENQADCIRTPAHIRRPIGATVCLPSSISSIKVPGKHSPSTEDASSFYQHALISTLGSEASGGSVYIMKFNESLDLHSRSTFKVASLNCTIWTAECHPDGLQAVLGTSMGAALLNLETGVLSWLCHSKSDVFSLQFDQSGAVILCGFRNGAVVTVDVRQKKQGVSNVISRHRIHYPSRIGHDRIKNNVHKRSKAWFELNGSIHPSSTIFMRSSISSLRSLQTDDQYFLASSMDGLIKLYDHRLIQRGPVQSYEGHVNSHTRLQLGVDPSEKLMMSGGEDGKVRIWSIKSGELLFGTKISNSAPTTVCWSGIAEELNGTSGRRRLYEESLYEQNHSWGAWLGSAEGLFYIHGI